MERGLILLVAALVACMASGVQGRSHLSFDPNGTVNINRTGCGTTKLCVETPADCDPGSSTCLFASVIAGTPVPNTGVPLSIELSGSSMGYIALGLSLNASEGITMLYICARNNTTGMFFFRTMDKNNTDAVLTPNERGVSAIRGTVNGTMIQCEFNIQGVNSTTTTRSDAMFMVSLGSGPVGTGGAPGAFNTTLSTGVLNLQDPASNIPTTTAPTTTLAGSTAMGSTAMGNTTMAGSGAVQPHAVLLLLSLLALPVMLKA